MNLIKNIFKEYNIALDNKQFERLSLFAKILVEENKKINLTRIISDEDVVKKHFLDSCFLLPFVKGKLLDIGSGAGFPGLVIAIMKSVEVTIYLKD